MRGEHRVTPPRWLDGAGVVTAALGSTETTAQLHPASFTAALIEAAPARVHLGVVQEIVQRDGAAVGVRVDGATLAADAVVLALGPWTSHVAGRLLPRIRGLKGYSVTLDAAGVPPHALFVDYRTADGRSLEPEIFPRPDGSVYVCGMADPQPLPESPEGVVVDDAACAVLARAAGRVSTTLAAAPITRRQACYRPVTDDGLPLIGRVPGVRERVRRDGTRTVGHAERAGHGVRARRAHRHRRRYDDRLARLRSPPLIARHYHRDRSKVLAGCADRRHARDRTAKSRKPAPSARRVILRR